MAIVSGETENLGTENVGQRIHRARIKQRLYDSFIAHVRDIRHSLKANSNDVRGRTFAILISRSNQITRVIKLRFYR